MRALSSTEKVKPTARTLQKRVNILHLSQYEWKDGSVLVKLGSVYFDVNLSSWKILNRLNNVMEMEKLNKKLNT